jgi:hypothetical protein
LLRFPELSTIAAVSMPRRVVLRAVFGLLDGSFLAFAASLDTNSVKPAVTPHPEASVMEDAFLRNHSGTSSQRAGSTLGSSWKTLGESR